MTETLPRCPGGDWTYDKHAACVVARSPGRVLPLIWVVGQGIVEARGSDPIDPSAMALALHILQDHPNSDTARLVGEWETYEPLRELNGLLTRAFPAHVAWAMWALLILGALLFVAICVLAMARLT